MINYFAYITGIGSYLPSRILSNEEDKFERMVNTTESFRKVIINVQ